MRDDRQIGESVVILSLEFDPSLRNILEPNHPFHAAISQALADGLTDLMYTLGIPGQPSIELHALEEASATFMNVQVNDQPCPYPLEIYQRVYSYIKDSCPDLKTGLDQIWTWIRSFVQEQPELAGIESFDNHTLVKFLTFTCLEIIKKQPAVLLGLAQVAAIKQKLPEPTALLVPSEEDVKSYQWPETEWLHAALTRVLQQHISLADVNTIGLTLLSLRTRTQEEIAEELIAKLSADIVEIQLPQDLLRKLTTAYASSWHGQLRALRRAMLQIYGLSLPDMRFVLNEDLKPDSFACKINNLLMFPWIAPPEDTLDVLQKRLMLNLHEHRTCFVHRRSVEQWLGQYAQISPVLFRLLPSKIPSYRITQALRILVLEQVSIRNLGYIMESLLNCRYIVANPALPMTFEEQLPVVLQEEHPQLDDPVYLASFIRIGLKRAISYQNAGEQQQLYCYVFQAEPEVEQALSSCQEYNMEQRPVPPDTQPVIITSIGIRPLVQDLVNVDLLPTFPVLAYQELIPGLHIQLVERIVSDTPAETAHLSDFNGKA